MTFKEQIANEIGTVFFNGSEFSECHIINGTEMPSIIDNNEMLEREKRYINHSDIYGDGVYRKGLLIYVKASDFGPLPAVGRTVTVDSKRYTVSDAVDEGGIYSISLEANMT